MATLIPSLGSARFDAKGELRLAERLKDFLEDNTWVWHNLPVGPPDQFKVALSQVEKELLSAGFKIEKIDKDALDYQYIVIASAPEKQPPTGEK